MCDGAGVEHAWRKGRASSGPMSPLQGNARRQRTGLPHRPPARRSGRAGAPGAGGRVRYLQQDRLHEAKQLAVLGGSYTVVVVLQSCVGARVGALDAARDACAHLHLVLLRPRHAVVAGRQLDAAAAGCLPPGRGPPSCTTCACAVQRHGSGSPHEECPCPPEARAQKEARRREQGPDAPGRHRSSLLARRQMSPKSGLAGARSCCGSGEVWLQTPKLKMMTHRPHHVFGFKTFRG